jgi:hypothetical protein
MTAEPVRRPRELVSVGRSLRFLPVRSSTRSGPRSAVTTEKNVSEKKGPSEPTVLDTAKVPGTHVQKNPPPERRKKGTKKSDPKPDAKSKVDAKAKTAEREAAAAKRKADREAAVAARKKESADNKARFERAKRDQKALFLKVRQAHNTLYWAIRNSWKEPGAVKTAQENWTRLEEEWVAQFVRVIAIEHERALSKSG